jgi:hypothetical protein
MNSWQIPALRAGGLRVMVAAAGCVAAPPMPLTELARARTAIARADQAGAAPGRP